jgi:hypothetical protein
MRILLSVLLLIAFGCPSFGRDVANWPVLKALIHLDKQVVYILDPSRISPEQTEALAHLQTKGFISTLSLNQYLIVGDGVPFEVMKEFAKHQEISTAPAFKRSLRAASQHEIPLIFANVPGNVAAYSLDFKEVYLSNISSFHSGYLIHEINHDRFLRFQKRLQSWLNKKNWVLPYEVDGDRTHNIRRSEFLGSGGVMNILDEVEAWRKTIVAPDEPGFRSRQSSLEKKAVDLVLEFYLKDFGAQAIEEFKTYYTAEDFAGKSVAKVILDQARKLNQKSRQELYLLGSQGFAEGSRADMLNFLNVKEARLATEPLRSEERELILRMADFSGDPLIRSRAKVFGDSKNFFYTDQNRNKEFGIENESLAKLDWERKMILANEANSSSDLDALMVEALEKGILLGMATENPKEYFGLLAGSDPLRLPRFRKALVALLEGFEVLENLVLVRRLLMPPKDYARGTIAWTMTVLLETDFSKLSDRRLKEVIQFFGETLPWALQRDLGVEPARRNYTSGLESLESVRVRIAKMNLNDMRILAKVMGVFEKILAVPSPSLAPHLNLALRMNPMLWHLVQGNPVLQNLPPETVKNLQDYYSRPVVAGSCRRVHLLR